MRCATSALILLLLGTAISAAQPSDGPVPRDDEPVGTRPLEALPPHVLVDARSFGLGRGSLSSEFARGALLGALKQAAVPNLVVHGALPVGRDAEGRSSLSLPTDGTSSPPHDSPPAYSAWLVTQRGLSEAPLDTGAFRLVGVFEDRAAFLAAYSKTHGARRSLDRLLSELGDLVYEAWWIRKRAMTSDDAARRDTLRAEVRELEEEIRARLLEVEERRVGSAR